MFEPLFSNIEKAGHKNNIHVHQGDALVILDNIDDKYPNLEIIKYEVWHNDENASLLTQVEEKLYEGVTTKIKVEISAE